MKSFTNTLNTNLTFKFNSQNFRNLKVSKFDLQNNNSQMSTASNVIKKIKEGLPFRNETGLLSSVGW